MRVSSELRQTVIHSPERVKCNYQQAYRTRCFFQPNGLQERSSHANVVMRDNNFFLGSRIDVRFISFPLATAAASHFQ